VFVLLPFYFEEDNDLPLPFPIDSVLRLAAAEPPESIGRSRDAAMDGRPPLLLHHRSTFGSVRRKDLHARKYDAQGWTAEAALRRPTPNAGTDRRFRACHSPADRGGGPGGGGRRQRRGHGGQVHVRTIDGAVSNPVASDAVVAVAPSSEKGTACSHTWSHPPFPNPPTQNQDHPHCQAEVLRPRSAGGPRVPAAGTERGQGRGAAPRGRWRWRWR
jgi:hypothetical protein